MTPSAASLSQDKVFVGALKVLPLALFDAMKQAELLDSGLLKSDPRSLWKDLKAPGRTDVARRTAASSSAVSPPISSTVSPTVSFFPCVRYCMLGRWEVGGRRRDPVVVGTVGTFLGICDGSSSSVCLVPVVSAVGTESFEMLEDGRVAEVFSQTSELVEDRVIACGQIDGWSAVRSDGSNAVATAELQSLLADAVFPHALRSATATSPISAPDNDKHTAVHTPERHSATPSTIPPSCSTVCGSSTQHATPPCAVHERGRGLSNAEARCMFQAILMHAQKVQCFVTDQLRQWMRRVEKVVQAA